MGLHMSEMILLDNHQLYVHNDVVMYAPIITGHMDSPSCVQRHKVAYKLGVRMLMTTQQWSPLCDWHLSLRGYAIDNGAYISFIKNEPFPKDRFLNMCQSIGDNADWIAIPDVVTDKVATLRQANYWINTLKKVNPNTPLLFVWQDHMTREDLLPFVRDGIGIFIGGSTSMKLQIIPMISDLCKEYGVWSHCGRVNSPHRLDLVMNNGIYSFDGSSFTRFINTAQDIHNYLEQRKYEQQYQTSLFDIPRIPKDFSMLTDFQQRNAHFKINISKLQDMVTINTDYIGISNDKPKSYYSILRWD